MNLPLSWLKDYMNTDGISDAEYNSAMTMSGSKVEVITNKAEEIKNVVIGKINKIEKHPDADKLVVCSVDVGEDEPIQIVTGASNVFEGAAVVVAKHKSTLPGGVKITKGKLRGVVSFGMLCSTDELGMSSERATGVLILPDDAPIGEDAAKYLGLDESVVEFEITPNRPDCMSIIGLARETAATFNREFNLPSTEFKEAGGNVADCASVEIDDSDLCSRFVGRVVKNVKIQPSPQWMQKRLNACGIRAINNVVDITNYILLEYGQPMHAYNLDNVIGNKIIVRKAKQGEKLETLDDQPRELGKDMIVISDAERAIGVAGVMGGANSEVTEDTSTVLFESACFNSVMVRRGAKALGMRTDASALFEKGLDAENCLPAINRACKLLSDMGCGDVVSGVIDVYPAPKGKVKLPFEPGKINALLGTDISKADMVNMLNKLEFEIDGDTVTVPSFRSDIKNMADIAEEVARLYGYDKIPSTMMRGNVAVGGKNKKQRLEDKINETLRGCGYSEVMSYSFIDPDENKLMNIPDGDERYNFVKIINPLGVENSVMRTDMLSSMMEILKTNFSRRNPRAALFEIGSVYIPKDGSQLPDEPRRIALGMYGNGDFYSIKGAVEQALESVGVFDYDFEAETGDCSFHPGRCANIYIAGEYAGRVGQIHPKAAENYKIDAEVYCAEIDFGIVYNASTEDRTFKQLPKFPASGRDIAMVVDKNVGVGSIAKIIKLQQSDIIESFKLFDVYEGKQVGDGKKSVAYSILFRAADRTLTDEEIEKVMNGILNDLKQQLGAELR